MQCITDHHHPGWVNFAKVRESQIVDVGKRLSEEFSIQSDFAADFMGIVTGLQTEMIFARRYNIRVSNHDWARGLG